METQHTENWDNPFPGPIALSEGFPVFGREEELAILRGLLITERVVVLHGVSGAGKSSLLRGTGGVRDRFSSESDFSVLGPVEFRLSDLPEQHERHYERFLIELLNREELTERQAETASILENLDLELFLIRRGNQLACADQLVIIDQFEEIFARCPHDEKGKAVFFAALGKTIECNPDVRILFAMRDEYLGELDHYRKYMPGRFQARLRLELLRKEQAVDAICKTAAHHPIGATLCEDDVGNLVDNLSQITEAIAAPGGQVRQTPSMYVEPLFLQLACRDAWASVLSAHGAAEQAHTRPACLPMAHGSNPENFDHVLRAFYRSALGAIVKSTGEDEFKLRVFIQDGLIESNGLRGQINEAQAANLWGVSNASLDMLADQHLLRIQKRNLVSYFELAHDRLVAPVRQDNSDWLAQAERPNWRCAARRDHLGASDVTLSFFDLLKGRKAAAQFGPSLIPYEVAFIRKKENENIRFPLKIVLTIVVTAGVIISLTGYVLKMQIENLESIKRSLEGTIAALMAEEAALIKDKEKLEKDIRQVREDNAIAGVFKEISKYNELKWVLRNDQAATQWIVTARKNAEERFPGERGIPFHNALLTAFNNALTPLLDAPGYSRSLPALGGITGPVAFQGGAEPLMAKVTNACLVITDLRTSLARDACLKTKSTQIDTLEFLGEEPGFLVIRGRSGSSAFLELISLQDTSAAKPVTGAIKRLVLTQSGANEAYVLSDDGAIFAVAEGQRVDLFCRDGEEWTACGTLSVPVGGKDSAASMALSSEIGGTRDFALGTASGDIFSLRLALGAATEPGGPRWINEAHRIQRIDAPERIFHIGEDRRRVLAMRFLSTAEAHLLASTESHLLAVHEDTQLFLIDTRAKHAERTRRDVLPDVGSATRGVGRSNDRHHYQSAIFASDGTLYTVLEDAIEQWTLREWPGAHDTLGWRLPVVRYQTGARNLTHLAVGQRYLIGRGEFAVWAWELDVTGSKLVLSTFKGSSTEPTVFYPQAIEFAPDNSLLVGTTGQSLTRWSANQQGGWSRTSMNLAGCIPVAIRALARSPDGRLVAAAGAAKQLMLIDFNDTPPRVWCDSKHHADGLWSIAFSSDGSWLASGDWNDTTDDRISRLLLWALTSDAGKKVRYAGSIDWHGPPVRAIAFHPTRPDLLAVGGLSGGVHLYHLGPNGVATELRNADGTPLLQPKGEPETGSILNLSFSHNGQVLAAADGRGQIRMWRLAFDNAGIPPPPCETPLPTSMHGTQTATHAKHNVVASKPCVLDGHAGGARTVRFHPSKPLLVSGGADNLIKIWNVGLGAKVPAILRSVDADVLDIRWDRTGERLVAGFKSTHARTAPKHPEPGQVVTLSWDLSELERIACREIWPSSWSGPNPCAAQTTHDTGRGIDAPDRTAIGTDAAESSTPTR